MTLQMQRNMNGPTRRKLSYIDPEGKGYCIMLLLSMKKDIE